jgi:hypothetical protein
VSEFVEQCRREWKRLGVSDPLAEEMATDLASDLNEAEADGVSVEELLGSSAFDPATFAATWAAERGVIPPQAPVKSQSILRRPLTLGVSAVLVFVVLFFFVLFGTVLITRAAPPTVAFRRAGAPSLRILPGLGLGKPLPGPGQLMVRAYTGVNAAPLLLLLLLLAIVAIVITWLWTARTRSRPPSASV